MKMKIYRNEKQMARLLLMCMDGKFTIKKEKTKMGNDDDMMTAEEFFGGIEPKRSKRIGACRTRRKKSAKAIFLEAKAKMIMRIYGVSRAKALEIAASREAGENEDDSGRPQSKPKGRGASRDDDLMSAEEFFS